MAPALKAPQNIHASCVAAHGAGLLILGPSGAGKSALALQLIALGADLVADDRCEVWAAAGTAFARAPAPIAGLIEARGIGILRLSHLPQTPLRAVIDLSQTHPPRMPAPSQTTVAGIALDFLQFSPAPHFPSALMCYLMGQRHL